MPSDRARSAKRSAGRRRAAGTTTLRSVHTALASACAGAASGFETCARRSRDATIVVAAASAARNLRSIVDAVSADARRRAIDAAPRGRTCERLRWEWLASTASLVDGHGDIRLLAECARMLEQALSAVSTDTVGVELAARLRLAAVEAFSLARAAEIARERSARERLEAELGLALAFG